MAILRASTLEYHDVNAYRVVSWPAGAQVGDLVVVAIANRFLPSLPVGWTTTHVLSGTNQSGRLAWRILSGADIGGGTYTYVLAGTGTGSVATFCFAAGTFNPADPIGSYVDSIAADVNEFMPYVPINTGQSVYHVASARTATAGSVISDEGVLVARIDTAPDVEAAVYADPAASETTRHTTWTATAPSTGSYKVSFVPMDPIGTIRLPGLSSLAYLIVASYGVAPVSPAPAEVVSVNNPALTVMASGSSSPFQVQFQTSSSSGFGTTSWSTTLTGVVPGLVSASVGVGLPNQSTSWWRARAGDGTTWGPWTAGRSFRVELGLSMAFEYVTDNVGGALVLAGDASEYVTDNVGLPSTPADITLEYVHENVGFLATASSGAYEYLYNYVYVGIPKPHLWFVYKVYGFATDHVFLFGQGLGTLQEQYHASIKFDYGPDFTTADLTPAIFDWSVNAAGVHAYDAQRKIYAGAEGAPPFANVECDIVEVIVPSAAVAADVQTDFFYAVTDGGPSNRVQFLLYPVIPLPMGTSASQNSSGGAVRLGGDPVGVSAEIIENYAAYTIEPYILAGGRPERLPQGLSVSRSTFSLTVSTPTTDLEDPVTATVPLSPRWRPLGGDVDPRPDIGTGASLWTPTTASTQGWKIFSDTGPYVDAAHVIPSRLGDIPRPAMVFPGDAFADLLEPLPSGPSFAMAMVVQIYAKSSTKTVLLSSHGSLPTGKHHLELSLTSDLLSYSIGGRLAQYRIPKSHFGQRPIMVGLGLNNKAGYLMVTTRDTQNVVFASTALPTSGVSLYLGRATDGDPDTMAVMDVLDLALKPSYITAKLMWVTMNALDSIYGVTDS